MKYLTNVATLQLFPENCSGCKRCIEVCPRGVFAMNGKTVFVTDKDLCIECGACVQNCAFGAISVNAGVGCAAAIINSMVKGGSPSCGCSSSAESCCG